MKDRLPKTAIIGADGFIGRHLLCELRKYYSDCIGTSHHRDPRGLFHLDLQNPKIDQVNLTATGHKVAIIAAGITSVDSCEDNIAFNRRINVEGVCELLQQLKKLGVLPIFLSSDYVFDGKLERGYSDFDLPCPNTEYGRQKAIVEEEIQNSGKPYMIIRLSKVFGTVKGDQTIIDEIMNLLRNHQEVKAAYDQVFCPTWVHDVVNVILEMLQNDCRGLYNVCSSEIWNRYDLALAIADQIGYSHNLVKRVSIDDIFSFPKRPKRTNIECIRLHKETPFAFTPVLECIRVLSKAYQ